MFSKTFKLLSLLVLLNIVAADYQLTIALDEILVDGKLQSGEFCSPYQSIGVNCFPRPKICIEPGDYIDTNIDRCAIGSYIDLGVWDNTNDLKFDPQGNYGGWSNPMVFNFFGGTDNGFSVKLIIWNADRTNYQVIDKVQWNVTKDTADAWHDVTKTSTTHISSLTFKWKLTAQVEPTAAPTSSTASGSTSTGPSLPTDCSTATTAGPYTTTMGQVWCDGTGGIAIQRRTTATGDFETKSFTDYKGGFGSASDSYWLGLDNIHTLTEGGNYGAMITVCCGANANSEIYDSFQVGDEASNYVLTVTNTPNTTNLNAKGSYTNTTDNGAPFSTFADFHLQGGVDNTLCASALGGGGWWFGSCANNLNGYYYPIGDPVYNNTATCEIKTTADIFNNKGAGISYPVQISYQKTQILFRRKDAPKKFDINAAAEAFCTSP